MGAGVMRQLAVAQAHLDLRRHPLHQQQVPETRVRVGRGAQQRDGLPAQPLYRVRFLQKDVWPGYRGSAADVVEIEIYQHWLE